MATKKRTKATEVAPAANAAPTEPAKREAAPPAENKTASVVGDLADQLRCRPDQLMNLLRTTCFRACKRNEEFMMACMVARGYRLNPILKEIYAFPSQNGVVPIVSVDGWSRIMNSHPLYDGIKFTYSGDIERDENGDYIGGTGDLSCTAEVWRKDRRNPISVTEFYEECWRDTDPWNTMPRRMLRWKALIQAARVAFGFAGIYDFDEGNDILAHDGKRVTKDGTIVDIPVAGIGMNREGNITGVSEVDSEAITDLVYENEPDPTEDDEPVAKVVDAPAISDEPVSDPDPRADDSEEEPADEDEGDTEESEEPAAEENAASDGDDDFPW